MMSKKKDTTALKIPVEVTRLLGTGEIVNENGKEKPLTRIVGEVIGFQTFPNLFNY